MKKMTAAEREAAFRDEYEEAKRNRDACKDEWESAKQTADNWERRFRDAARKLGIARDKLEGR